jgi:four helix bundle protein
MQDYRQLLMWHKAHRLVLDVYADSAKFLRHPDAWPVKDQMVRAAISVPSNMAEGAGRGSDLDFRRFLFHSLGSSNELEYDLLLARDVSFIPAAVHRQRTEQLEEVRRMLSAFIQRLTV